MTAEQTAAHIDWEEAQREEMTRKHALELLLEDKELTEIIVRHIVKDNVITPRDAA